MQMLRLPTGNGNVVEVVAIKLWRNPVASLERASQGFRLPLVIVRRDEKVRLISRVPLFEACSQPELARVATITTQVDVPEGEVLIREGEPRDLFFVLVKGSAEVRKGKRRVATLGAGDFAGEIALLTDAPRTATVRTTSPVTALRATRKGFSALLETSPRIQRKVLKALADRLAPTAL
jgi:CRP-like cAMP-binding protein